MLQKHNKHVQGLMEHWKRQRKDPCYTDKRNTAVNDCFKPSNEASKADLAEYHREEMKLRRARRRGYA